MRKTLLALIISSFILSAFAQTTVQQERIPFFERFSYRPNAEFSVATGDMGYTSMFTVSPLGLQFNPNFWFGAGMVLFLDDELYPGQPDPLYAKELMNCYFVELKYHFALIQPKNVVPFSRIAYGFGTHERRSGMYAHFKTGFTVYNPSKWFGFSPFVGFMLLPYSNREFLEHPNKRFRTGNSLFFTIGLNVELGGTKRFK